MTNPARVHGTRLDPSRQHPVFDLPYWEQKCPLGDDRRATKRPTSPPGLAFAEQARRLAASNGDLGTSVPADFFVWAVGEPSKPWLTCLGGSPWREADKPWPRDADGIPLAFLGQICFVDSLDVLPEPPPKPVALFFGTYQQGWATVDQHAGVEWSPLRLRRPHDRYRAPWTAELPFTYQGVIHRSVQYTDREDAPFKAAGFQNGGFELAAIQTTSIGQYSALPQGWPWMPDEPETLVCTLGSICMRGSWPLCDVPRGLSVARADGSEFEQTVPGMDFGIGDAGVCYIYRDADGDCLWHGECS